MSAARHLSLMGQSIAVWAAFWLAGLPRYYQQYDQITMAVVCILVAVALSLWAIHVLSRGRPETTLRRAVWISFYFTIPFAILDGLYCGIYLGHGLAFLATYWYVTVFYFTPWLTFIPTALLLQRARHIGHLASPGPRGGTDRRAPVCDPRDIVCASCMRPMHKYRLCQPRV